MLVVTLSLSHPCPPVPLPVPPVPLPPLSLCLSLSLSSLVARPLPDFISQLKIGTQKPRTNTATSRTRKGGLGFVMMATCVQYSKRSNCISLPRRFANSYGLRKYQVANEGHVDVSGRCYACTLTEESSRLRASASLRVKTSRCTRATILKDGETDGKATCRYVQVI